MVELARSDREHAPPAVASNRALWCGLDGGARERAANCGLLLLDINFTDPAWWRAAAADRPVERTGNLEGYLQPAVAAELMRETITLAWIVAREDRGQATIFCGLAPPVATQFASFSPSDLDRLSARYHRHLRLRFDDQPSYWRMHLTIDGSKWVSRGAGSEVTAESY
ncbi:hypothetical protein ACFPN2_21505 [Steroidobacter flavus]|uniref:DUF4123 domain-containing protein n=1 Tax=Steroidobacter flavus TaxID=1842136 RepID=A0ABV8SW30_9GAMM